MYDQVMEIVTTGNMSWRALLGLIVFVVIAWLMMRFRAKAARNNQKQGALDEVLTSAWYGVNKVLYLPTASAPIEARILVADEDFVYLESEKTYEYIPIAQAATGCMGNRVSEKKAPDKREIDDLTLCE